MNGLSMTATPFGLAETHGILRLPGVSGRISSETLSWRSMFISAQAEQPFGGDFLASDPLIVFHRRPTMGFAPDGTRHHGAAGSMLLVAPDLPFLPGLGIPTETVHVYIRRQVWDDVALDLTGKAAPAPFATRFVHADPTLFALCNAGLAAVEAGETEQVFVDYLAWAMATHVLVRHQGVAPRLRGASSGRFLSPEVSRAIEYIEANLSQPVSIEDVARASFRSASYLTKIFRDEMGLAPHRYLIEARIRRAQSLLAKSAMPIIEIALECGFTHQEHMTRWFQRQLQTTPAAYRRAHGQARRDLAERS
jgi:AraC family transcriptional regulator